MHTGSLVVLGAALALGGASGYARHGEVVTTPHGRAEMSSYGLALIDPDPQPLDAQPIMTMHVRAALLDDAGAPWTVDASQALLVLPDGTGVHPLAINAALPALPHVALAPGERATVDFYFPMPTTIYDDTDVPSFAVDWLGIRTKFSRVPEATGVVIEASASHLEGWWFDPHHAWTQGSPNRAIVAWLQGAQTNPDE